MRIELNVNGATHALEVEQRTTLLDCLRDQLALKGAHAGCEHGVCGACTVLFDGAAVRSCLMFAPQAEGSTITTIEGVTPGPGELSPIQDAFCETHGMQCGYCTPAMILTAHALLAGNPAPTREDIVEAISGNICRCTGYAQIIEAIALAAERMRGANRPRGAAAMSGSASSLCRARSPRARRPPLRRRQRQLRRRYRPARHIARRAGDVPARGRAHQINRQVRGAQNAGRPLCIGRRRACRRHRRADPGLETPNVPRRPLAFETARYSGEWVAAVAAETRAQAEDAAEAIEIDYEPLPFVLDAEKAMEKGRRWCTRARLQRAARQDLRVGRGRQGFRRQPEEALVAREMGPLSTVPIETFGVVARWDPWREILDVWASIQMPRYAEQIAAALKIPLLGARALRCRRRRQLWRQARHQALGACWLLARRLGLPCG